MTKLSSGAHIGRYMDALDRMNLRYNSYKNLKYTAYEFNPIRYFHDVIRINT